MKTSRSAFGLRPYRGEIRIHGQRANIGSPTDAIQQGMYLIPADRRGSGAFLTMNVQDNVIASNLKDVSQVGLLRRNAVRKKAQKFYQELDIRASGLGQLMANLSGGNQQKTILARGLATDPSVLVLHEPTRGFDVGAKAEIYRILQNLAIQGSAILIISSELPELISQCDRILVMHAGRIHGEFTHGAASEEGILASMMGHQQPA
jgi:ribose transport system ATP-binding protein